MRYSTIQIWDDDKANLDKLRELYGRGTSRVAMVHKVVAAYVEALAKGKPNAKRRPKPRRPGG